MSHQAPLSSRMVLLAHGISFYCKHYTQTKWCRPPSPSTHACMHTHTCTPVLRAVGNFRVTSNPQEAPGTTTIWAETPAYINPKTQAQHRYTPWAMHKLTLTRNLGTHQNIAKTLLDRLVPEEWPPKQIPKNLWHKHPAKKQNHLCPAWLKLLHAGLGMLMDCWGTEILPMKS